MNPCPYCIYGSLCPACGQLPEHPDPREQEQRATVRAKLEAQAEAERRPPCVKCSECDGFHHTSFEYAEFEGDDGEFSHYGCKHCDARFESCPGCGGPLVDGTCHGECGEDQP